MRLQITHLKAPWPAGAVVGDVLDLPVIPAWAAGKCVQVGDVAALTIITGDGTGKALQPINEDDHDQSRVSADQITGLPIEPSAAAKQAVKAKRK